MSERPLRRPDAGAWLDRVEKEGHGLVTDDVLPYAVQVNGKLRAEVQMPASANEAEVRAAAEAEERVKAHLQGRALRKVVFVPRRLINFVVG